ncbi:oxidoreductase family protein [Acidiluteibacter ferrifornacis]|uniref:oxidoreductase family protein n=1 Tax=Acidiluteibacter ferrifornacis TaxID=2692424 RepID=UPI00293BC770|nr:oxidoreductase family protein [Acidiluteibacter ferrifornacis]
MTNHSTLNRLLSRLNYPPVVKTETIQTLWSGYGKILRLQFDESSPKSIIAKLINLHEANSHPRGWNTDRSHLRKVKSYEVEMEWYKNWAYRCDASCRIPKCYASQSTDDQHLIILEDLDASGYPFRKSNLNVEEAKVVLKWLANFHALFLNDSPTGLWEEGTYWHLATRPDEFDAMADSPLKQKAFQIDEILRNCTYKTIVHGDAKVANFCFSKDMKQVAAVDFQYVGGGCGMKDVVYFLGSCLSEKECERLEEQLLDYYFQVLKSKLMQSDKVIDIGGLEKEWRILFPIAWADFTRFLLGWMPTHQKLNGYSERMVEKAFSQIFS